MNAVLQRELVVQARQARTYWLRFLAGLALATTLGGQMVTLGDLARAMGLWRGAPTGAELFAGLHTVISLVLLFTAPLIAADSIARERREGTLGLLALTPLQPFEIVLGKVGAHVIRLFSLWLVSLPVLMIPVLMGGVNWVDVKCAVAIEFALLAGGLAAGVLASTLATTWTNTAGLALFLAFVLGQSIATTAGLAAAWVGQGKVGGIGSLPGSGVEFVFAASVFPWAAATGLPMGGFSPMLSLKGAWLPPFVDAALLGAVLVTVTALVLATRFSGRRIPGLLRQETSGAPVPQRLWEKVREKFRGRPSPTQRARWLRENPARWLFAFTSPAHTDRVITFWLAVAVAGFGIYANLKLGEGEVLVFLAPLFCGAVAVGAALVGAASFRREVEEGTLELLLVTGLPPRELIRGRVRQLWAACLPALLMFGLCLGLGLLLDSENGNADAASALVALVCCATAALGAVPIGIRYAVRRLNPLHAWFWTLLTSAGPPLLLGGASSMLWWGLTRGTELGDAGGKFAYLVGFCLTEFALARTWFWLAANDLDTRLFMLKPFQRRPC